MFCSSKNTVKVFTISWNNYLNLLYVLSLNCILSFLPFFFFLFDVYCIEHQIVEDLFLVYFLWFFLQKFSTEKVWPIVVCDFLFLGEIISLKIITYQSRILNSIPTDVADFSYYIQWLKILIIFLYFSNSSFSIIRVHSSSQARDKFYILSRIKDIITTMYSFWNRRLSEYFMNW